MFTLLQSMQWVSPLVTFSKLLFHGQFPLKHVQERNWEWEIWVSLSLNQSGGRAQSDRLC